MGIRTRRARKHSSTHAVGFGIAGVFGFIALFALASTCSSVRGGRVESRPDGSPIRAVPLPMMSVTLWPRSWNWRILRRGTAWPRWRSGLVGSTPSLMLSGTPRSSFLRSSSMGTICMVPDVMTFSCSSTGSKALSSVCVRVSSRIAPATAHAQG